MNDKENSTRSPKSSESQAPLEGWKEIATYLQRDVTTAKRWEKNEALPVRRHQHQARASVYAYPSELDAWLATRQPAAELAALWFRRPASALATAAVLLLALASVASGPLVNPPGAAAEDGVGMIARQVWAGPGVDIFGAPSPDGRYLSFVDWETGDLAIRNLETGETRRLTNKGSWVSSEYALYSRFSPDSQQVVFTWFNGTRYDLRVVGVDGSGLRVLHVNEDVRYMQPGGWSPDGRLISVRLARRDGVNQLALYSLADDSFRVIKSMDWRHPHLAAFSPDGEYLAYDFPPEEDSQARDVFLLSVDASRETRLVEHPANDRVLGWTPDGKEFLFSSDRTGTTGLWSLRVAEGQPQGSPRLVKPAIGEFTSLGFTTEGDFYYGLETGIRDAYMVSYDPVAGKVTGEPEPVSQYFVGSNRRPAWSPDGKRLAYLSYRSSALLPPVVVIESVVSREKQEFSPQLHFWPSVSRMVWSPDSHYLLAVAEDSKARRTLYRIDARTGETTRLVRPDEGLESEIVMPTWTEAGIFYLRKETPPGESIVQRTSLVKRDPETGREEVVYQVERPTFLSNFALSPDGTRIVVVHWGDSRSLKIIPAEGGEARDLISNIHGRPGLEWTPDGRYVLVGHEQADSENVELWRVSVEEGQPEKLGLTRHNLRALDLHPDGRRLAFTAGDAKSEVWVLENFLPQLEVAQAE